MKKFPVLIMLSALLVFPRGINAKTTSLTSPDKKIVAILEDGPDEMPLLSVEHEGKQLLLKSKIGLDVKGRKAPLKIKGVKKASTKKETISAPFHHSPSFETAFNELKTELGDGLSLTLRAYNDGVSYRFSTVAKGDYVIENEIAEFNFVDNPDTYLSFSTNEKKPTAMAFQNFYRNYPIGNAPDKLAFLPAAADFGEGLKVVILESDLESYPGMFVRADSVSGSLKAEFAKFPASTYFSPRRKQMHVKDTEDFIAKGSGKRDFPWRVISVTTSDTQMPTSNLVYSLASPSRVDDTSWIKPGKVAWDWWNDWGLRNVDFKAGINTETYKYYIDFASKNGIEYVVLDEGWYVPQSGDMLTVIPEIDLPGLLKYAEEKNVGIVLWTVFNVLDSQLEEACKKYADMGVKGFKVDFLDRDDQTATEMAYRIADAAAKHNLMLDYHGFYKPSGLNRTYPNLVNFEGVFGLEELKWASPEVDMPLYDVTFPYLRMMSGPADYTQGAMRNASKKDFKAIYYNPMSQGTRSHQIATYVVFDSPFTMLCDSPSLYMQNQETVDFITAIPTVFEETKILDGKMGEYIVTLRRKGNNYYVGGLTSWTPRDYELDFSFLPAGNFKATIVRDGINAEKAADDHKFSKIEVNRDSKEKIHLAPGGGFALIIEPS